MTRLLCVLEGLWDTLRMGLRTGEWTPVSGHVMDEADGRCVRCHVHE